MAHRGGTHAGTRRPQRVSSLRRCCIFVATAARIACSSCGALPDNYQSAEPEPQWLWHPPFAVMIAKSWHQWGRGGRGIGIYQLQLPPSSPAPQVHLTDLDSEVCYLNRFANVVIHARFQTPLPVTLGGIGSHGNDPRPLPWRPFLVNLTGGRSRPFLASGRPSHPRHRADGAAIAVTLVHHRPHPLDNRCSKISRATCWFT